MLLDSGVIPGVRGRRLRLDFLMLHRRVVQTRVIFHHYEHWRELFIPFVLDCCVEKVWPDSVDDFVLKV